MMIEPANQNRCTPLEFAEAVELVNEYLAGVVAGVVDLPASLEAAMIYSLLAGGKRLRPGLVLLVCDALGGEVQRALAAAAALEMVHCFSLIHDDLPAMDDDDLRRGQATNHQKFGEAVAILAGDGLATLPYLVMARDDEITDEQRVLLTAELAEGTLAMIAGQVYDTVGDFADKLTVAERLELTHRKKTGALIRAGCRMGGIVAEANAADLAALSDYGSALGLMFQIVDDVLDVTQTTEHLGKGAGKDDSAGKLTYPGVHGLETARAMIAGLHQDARTALKKLTVIDGCRLKALDELVSNLATRTK